MEKKKGLSLQTILTIAGIALIYVLAFLLDRIPGVPIMLTTVLRKGAIYSLVAVSMNLLNGFTGLFSLGQAGFMLVGAYAFAAINISSGIRSTVYQYYDPLLKFSLTETLQNALGNTAGTVLGVFVSLLLAGLLAAGLAYLIGLPVLKLKSDYLAIATLGFAEIIRALVQLEAFAPVTNGSQLLRGFPYFSDTFMPFVIVGICIAVVVLLINSTYGRAFKAIRDDEIAAAASGVNTTYYKILTFVISAFFAGLAGGLYATCFSSLTTASFTFTSASIWNSTFIVVIVVLGGMGSMTGSVLAAVAMYLLNYEIKNGAWVSALPGFVQSLFQFPMLIYALVLLVVIIFRPRGILGTYEFSLDRLLFDGRLAGKRKAKARKGGADA